MININSIRFFLDEIPTKETLLKRQKDKNVKENQEKFDQMSKPKFIKNKVLTVAEKQKLGRTLDHEAKRKIVEAELRKIELDEYKKATQKSHIATKIAKPRISMSMTTTKKIKLSPRKQLMMKALKESGLKQPLKAKETLAVRKPTMSVKKNLIKPSNAKLKVVASKSSSKSIVTIKRKPAKVDKQISPVKDEKISLVSFFLAVRS